MRNVLLLCVVALAIAALPAPAAATFPGEDGRLALVVTDYDLEVPNSDVYTVEVDGTDLKRMTDTAADVRTVRWSPDGDHLAYVAATDQGDVIAIVPEAGGEPTVMLESELPRAIHGIAWSPDGLWIAVLADLDIDHAELSMMAVDDGTTTTITSFPGWVFDDSVDWSPDGQTIAIAYSVGDAPPNIVLVDINDGGGETLIGGAGPSWSPDGSSIVFDGAGGTSIIDADGSNLRVIPGLEYGEPPSPGLTVGYYPVWSPTGAEVAVIGFQGVGVDVVDVDTGDRRTVLSAFDPAIGPQARIYDVDWQSVAPPGGFTDVSSDYLFAESISWLAQNGITKGCNPPANDKFCPERSLTRGEAAALLVRTLGLPSPNPPVDRFIDDDATVFEDDIGALAEAGITKGCNPPLNDRYCPAATVRRGEFAALLTRALGLPPAAPDDDLFNDAVGSVFEGDITALAGAGITKGCNPPANTLFCPDRPLTRAEAAAFLHRAAQLGWLSANPSG